MESIEKNSTGVEVRRATTAFGKSCFKNRISEFDIFEFEGEGQESVEALLYAKRKADDVLKVMELVFELFVEPVRSKYIDSGNDDLLKKEYKFFQLAIQGARNAYAMYLRWKSESISFSQMIAVVVQHWKQNNEDGLVYVGKWGDVSRDRMGIWKNWINIKKKTEYELVNIAIVRVKDEQDYVDHSLFKFIEVLNDMGLVEEDLFLKLKYGTADQNKIFFIKAGFSSSLTNLLINKYKDKVTFDIEKNVIVIDPTLIVMMNQNEENEIVIHEVTYHIKS
ncbi:hypothetical protein [Bdellovibrio bacteriovorus]|uniref:Uncharacterized protein n=1 Tax=Bdellovibrio bacteriovorus TaxID=959 RepID=A0A1Z3N473_BDEBC|nr:hypothetical protein [Bdellovibrio bacteriovorus]ASD62270.1 hypothetical protein B9G79_01165 [Bdellovibrio bacteriovorus]